MKACSAPSRSRTCRSSAAARSSCCASCPASSRRRSTRPAFESVSFGGGANDTQGYTVNGIRSSNNTVSLDGSALIDIGSNSGVIVTLNNDMVQEVKVQSSNFAAEYGARRHERQRRHQGRVVAVPRQPLRLHPRQQFQANDRSNSIAGDRRSRRASISYPGGNVGGPILLPGFNKQRNKAFFFVGFEVQRQQVDSGSRFGVVPTLRQRNGDFSEFLTNNGQQPRSAGRQRADSGGLPERRPARSGQQPGAVHHAARPRARRTCTRSRTYIDPRNQIQLRLQPARADQPHRPQDAVRLQHLAATPRPTSASPSRAKTSRAAAVCGGVRRTSSCRRRTSARTAAAPTPATSSSVLSPTMTNEALVSFSRLRLDNTLQGSGEDERWPTTACRCRVRSARRQPVHPRRHPELGRRRQQHVGGRQRHVCAQRRADLLEQAHQDRRRARPQVRRLGLAPAEAAELPEQRGDAACIYAPGWSSGHAPATPSATS